MAGAYKCDICGTLFAERPSIEQDVTWFLAQTVDRGYTHPADMCQDCIDNLQLWVKNKGRGENNIIFYLRMRNRELADTCGRYKNEIERLQTKLRAAEAKIRIGVSDDQGRC